MLSPDYPTARDKHKNMLKLISIPYLER